jgi:hypothetical protein
LNQPGAGWRDAAGHPFGIEHREPFVVQRADRAPVVTLAAVSLPVAVERLGAPRDLPELLFVVAQRLRAQRGRFVHPAAAFAHRLIEIGRRRARRDEALARQQIGRMIDRHGERESLRDRRAHAERRDADGFARSIDQRSTAVAGIDRRVGLHERHAADVADGADDAARHGVLEAERRTERDDFLARSRELARSEWNRRLVGHGRVDVEHGDVGFG